MFGRRAQSAMEYLMTYGWAILVIIIVIAVLFYIGILNPTNVAPDSCTMPPGLACRAYKLDTEGKLSLTWAQATGHRINVTGIYCTQEQETVTSAQLDTYVPGVTILTGREKEISPVGTSYVQCRDGLGNPIGGAVGDMYRGKLWIRYVEEDTGTDRIIPGDISTKYEIR